MKRNNSPEAFKKAAEALKKKRDAHLDERDSLYLSPSERANLVITMIFMQLDLEEPKDAIEQPVFSDLLSFCIEFLGMWALQLDDEGLTRLVKQLSRTFYILHYSYPDGHPALGPHRDEHEKIWMKRIERTSNG